MILATGLHFIGDDLSEDAPEEWLATELGRVDSLLESHARFQQYLLTHHPDE